MRTEAAVRLRAPATPAAPPAGTLLYSKAGGGIFYRDAGGAEVGPLAVAGAAPANAVTVDTAQVVTGVKTFPPGALLMRNAAGTLTAEPYSDINAPDSFEMTLAGEPVAPPAGEAVLWTTAAKGLMMKAPDGTVTTIGPGWTPAVSGRTQGWQNDAASATLIAVGTTVPTVTTPGFAASLVNATPVNGGGGPATEVSTAATVNSVAGFVGTGLTRTAPGTVDSNYKVFSQAATVVSSNGAVRYWVGQFSATPSASDNPTTVTGYGFVVPSNSVNWSVWVGSGTAAQTFPTTVPGLSISSTSRQRSDLRIIATATQFDFYINGTLVQSVTTGLPASTTGLATYVQATTLTAASRGLALSRALHNLSY